MELPPPRKDAVPASNGTKKTTASLLPAFEPLSSPPALPKSLKRSRDIYEGKESLPTPVPTSSTHILSSSPPKSLARSLFKTTERVPLGALPSIRVKNDGTSTKLGRSSQTCDYQLSANRLISRVHVEINYISSISRLEREKLEICCTGWNGVKVHCQSKVYELRRGAIFSSDIRDAEIMLDVHDSRAIVEWPDKPQLGPVSSDEEELEGSPSKKLKPMRRHSTPPSPSPYQHRKSRSLLPLSPCPTNNSLLPSSPPVVSASDHQALVEIFEDETAQSDSSNPTTQETAATSVEKSDVNEESFETQSSELSSAQNFSDNDEENDPIVHSFGPFGANLLPRLAAVNAGTSPIRSSPIRAPRLVYSEPLKPISSPLQPKIRVTDFDVQGHVINQLAFSRLSSLPLSTILSHLPHDAQVISEEDLKQIIRETRCIGEVAREGKDAAGKALENEFYYIPDADDDSNRKQAVVNDLRKPGLRACRKQHKVCRSLVRRDTALTDIQQYYWKRPK